MKQTIATAIFLFCIGFAVKANANLSYDDYVTGKDCNILRQEIERLRYVITNGYSNVVVKLSKEQDADSERQRIHDRNLIYAASGKKDLKMTGYLIVCQEEKLKRDEECAIADEKRLKVIAEFDEWIKQHPSNVPSKKMLIGELCGFEFGDRCPLIAPHDLTAFTVITGPIVPFPPFTTLTLDYGKQVNHPLMRCTFGETDHSGYGIDEKLLTVAGDYENEARIIKVRIERCLGIKMSTVASSSYLYSENGIAYEYEDDYVRILLLACNDKTKWKSDSNTVPLWLSIQNVKLVKQDMFLNERYYTGKGCSILCDGHKIIAE